MAEPAPELALAAICDELARRKRRFALVGGLAVSVRAEVRFTRDVDLVVLVADDAEAESLILELRSAGYSAVASVEHETQHRLATIRLMVLVVTLPSCSFLSKQVAAGSATECAQRECGDEAGAARQQCMTECQRRYGK